MPTIEQVKQRYILKAEKNGVNDGLAVDRLRFCLLFNEAQNKFQTLHLQNRGVDDVRYIQKFLVLKHKVPYSSKSIDGLLYNFKTPKDYFDLADVSARAKKGKCSATINLVEIRTENKTEKLQDEFCKPSFEWEEAPYTVNSDLLSVYVSDFTISDILLDYYRYPNQIGLIDENNPESNFNEGLPVEWDEKALDDIISLMVFSFDINNNNPRYQLQTLRIQK
jgi:hypothetical protein|tara:strand:+ start:5422 stop:6087 length:666 start_codon:yes stop_codon:yes gene_type:complete